MILEGTRRNENPRSLTQARLAALAEQLDILLARSSPDPDAQTTGLDDVHTLWSYVVEVFGERSPLRTLLLKAVSQPVCVSAYVPSTSSTTIALKTPSDRSPSSALAPAGLPQ